MIKLKSFDRYPFTELLLQKYNLFGLSDIKIEPNVINFEQKTQEKRCLRTEECRRKQNSRLFLCP